MPRKSATPTFDRAFKKLSAVSVAPILFVLVIVAVLGQLIAIGQVNSGYFSLANIGNTMTFGCIALALLIGVGYLGREDHHQNAKRSSVGSNHVPYHLVFFVVAAAFFVTSAAYTVFNKCQIVTEILNIMTYSGSLTFGIACGLGFYFHRRSGRGVIDIVSSIILGSLLGLAALLGVGYLLLTLNGGPLACLKF